MIPPEQNSTCLAAPPEAMGEVQVRPRRVPCFLKLAIPLLLVLGLLFGAELILRRTGRFYSWAEKAGFSEAEYQEEKVPAPWLFILDRNANFVRKLTEFDYELITNSEGLPGEEIRLEKAPDEFRVVILGDSFTYGIGAPSGRGYVPQLRKLLNRSKGGKPVEVINAGVAGSDPVFYFEILERVLLKYKPDLVLATVNFSDFDDIKRRGGWDRFRSDGQLKSKTRPWFAWLFARSHVVRAFVLGVLHYEWNLRTGEENREASARVFDILVQTGKRFSESAVRNRFNFRFVVHPYPDEIRDGMHPEFERLLRDFRQNSVPFLDLYQGFLRGTKAGLSRFYWPIDMHFNEKGYSVFACVLGVELQKSGLLPKGLPKLDENQSPCARESSAQLGL